MGSGAEEEDEEGSEGVSESLAASSQLSGASGAAFCKSSKVAL
jgi:hypothetical protein